MPFERFLFFFFFRKVVERLWEAERKLFYHPSTACTKSFYPAKNLYYYKRRVFVVFYFYFLIVQLPTPGCRNVKRLRNRNRITTGFRFSSIRSNVIVQNKNNIYSNMEEIKKKKRKKNNNKIGGTSPRDICRLHPFFNPIIYRVNFTWIPVFFYIQIIVCSILSSRRIIIEIKKRILWTGNWEPTKSYKNTEYFLFYSVGVTEGLQTPRRRRIRDNLKPLCNIS